MYGSFSDYRNFQKALSLIDSEEKKEEYKKFNEDTRSSLNAIVKKAREIASEIQFYEINSMQKTKTTAEIKKFGYEVGE